MDKIYSRKRIHIPNVVYGKFNNQYEDKNKEKTLKIIVILIIAILFANAIINAINPIIDTLCKDKAKSIATIISNEKATEVMANYEYEDLMTIYRDSNDNITMIKANIIPINKIISDVAVKIQNALNEEGSQDLYVRLGSFTGTKILSGSGPKIPVKISTVGNVVTDFRSEFSSAGINQTLHRVYLQVDCTVSIVTPYDSIQETISNQVILIENVIVGTVPNTYYNIEGVNKDNLLDIVE